MSAMECYRTVGLCLKRQFVPDLDMLHEIALVSPMTRLEKALPVILILLALGAYGLMELPIDSVLVIARTVGWVLATILILSLVVRGLMKRNT